MKNFLMFFFLCLWYPSEAQVDTLGIEDCDCRRYNEDLDYCTTIIPKNTVFVVYNCLIEVSTFSPMGISFIDYKPVKLSEYKNWEYEINYINVGPLSERYISFYVRRPLKP